MSDYKDGDVIRYRPYRHHAMEGIALAETIDGKIRFFDTFWGYSNPTEVESLTDALFEFNLSDYDRVDNERAWLLYAEADRQVITHQHGLQNDYYIRKGAKEDLDTQILQARESVADARSSVDSAIRTLEFRWAELHKLGGRQ